MSPVDNEMISYFLTNLEDRVPFPAPGFPNMTILKTVPSLPVFPGSSFALVVLRNRVREGMVAGIDLLGPNTAGPQCLDDHCRGDISIGDGEEGGGGEGRGKNRCRSQSARATAYIYGEISNTANVDGDWGTPSKKPPQ